MKKQEQGALGEALARSYLESLGYRFIGANFRRRVGEIDLIMQEPRSLDLQQPIVFVEVRYRATSKFGGAIESIDWRKQRKMLRVALAWLQQNAPSTQTARIDVIAIKPHQMLVPDGEILWKHHQLTWLQNAVETIT